MKLVNYKNLSENQGNLMLAWGPTGSGKTSTILQTASDPIVLLTAEKRKIQTTIAAINRPDIKLKVGVYEDFSDCIDTVSKTEDERDKIIKELTMSVKMSKESYGALADNMLRLMNGLQSLTMAGFDVICTARSEERTRFNKTIAYGPSLSGQKFTFAMPGYFDFLCMLQSQDHDEDDKPPAYDAPMAELWSYHAPLASFDSTESYLAKWTGPIPPKGIIKRKFHVARVFKEANGVFA
jgi:hypothetical protein